ncbi:MAG: hypothetical protein ACXIUL_02825 [Wenzhouxiangella sp.]
MRKIGLIVILFLLALALWLWPRSAEQPVDQSEPPATGESVAFFLEGEELRQAPAPEASGARPANDQRSSRGTEPSSVILPSDQRAIWRVLDEGNDLLEELERELLEGQLTVDAFEAEQELWAALCEVLFYPDREAINVDIPLVFMERMERPCQSVTPELIDEIRERWEANFPQTQEELDRYQQEDRLFQLMQAQNVDGARAFLFDQMLEGLAAQSLSMVMESTWQLQQNRLLDLSSDSTEVDEWSRRFDLVVPTAVALALTCSQIGGCSDNHPLLLFLCGFPGRGACGPPLDLYQAIDQTLTGAEIAYFNQLLEHIERELRERINATGP